MSALWPLLRHPSADSVGMATATQMFALYLAAEMAVLAGQRFWMGDSGFGWERVTYARRSKTCNDAAHLSGQSGQDAGDDGNAAPCALPGIATGQQRAQ